MGVTIICGKRMRPFLCLLGLIFIYLAGSATRNIGIGSVVLLQVLMVHMEVLAQNPKSVLVSRLTTRWAAISTLLVILYLSVFSLAFPIRQWDKSKKEPGFGASVRYSYPVEAAEFLKSIGYKGNIMNSIELGGYLIWSGWPEWKVFADPRLEVGGQSAFKEYWSVFFYKGAYSDTSLMLLNSKDWAVVHIDHIALVFLRRGGIWDEVIKEKQITNPLEHEIIIPRQRSLKSSKSA